MLGRPATLSHSVSDGSGECSAVLLRKAERASADEARGGWVRARLA